jgi:hypothetical protein
MPQEQGAANHPRAANDSADEAMYDAKRSKSVLRIAA